MRKVKVAMSVLIDKSVCPHASGQQTAMHLCDERGWGTRAERGGAGELALPPHGKVDRQCDRNSVDEVDMPQLGLQTSL